MLRDFTKIVHKFVEANKDNAAMKEFVEPLAALNKEWERPHYANRYACNAKSG